MNYASGRVASRFTQRTTALRLCTQSSTFRPRALAQWSSLRAQASAVRLPGASISGCRPFTTSKKGSREAETSNPASQEFQDKNYVASGTAQRKVNDRPWQRENTGAHPEPTPEYASPTGDSKGMPAIDFELVLGRLLTTPTRLLKLILPMPFDPDQRYINAPVQKNSRDVGAKVEPLALLVHPQQPLSYLERLIQAEIPPLDADGREKLPEVIFRAEADRDESHTRKSSDNVASYSGLGREGPERSEANWVRWSGSTEVGDFIRDAARGKEFAIHIEGLGQELRVAVPSFKDRTHYMRVRLRRMSQQIDQMSKLKNECDQLAHKSAHRLAQGGFAALAGWWGIVYYVTFHTEMGWDLVEPVTYLAGLTTIMGGYLWFLYMSRDLSYKAAMNLTVSRRQNALYQERGFDVSSWEHHVHEANMLRREIKIVANEYDVEWNEMKDLGGEEVREVLESEEKDDEKDKKDKKKGNKEHEKNTKSN